MTMIAWLKRCAVSVEDGLRYHPRVRTSLSNLNQLRATLARADNDQARARTLCRLCASARLADEPESVERIMARIHKQVRGLEAEALDWSEFAADDSRRIARAAILKPYMSEREKGVLFVSFESEWLKLLRFGLARPLADRYALVVAPSSSPHNIISYVFPTVFPDPIFTLISHAEEEALLPRISPRYIVVPLYASNWVNPDLFLPLPHKQRDWDLIMVASFGKVKRHHALFAALRCMPATLRVLLVGQDQDGRNGDTILDLARCYGVADRIMLRRNARWVEVAEALCRSRLSVVLSRREGSCVVVAESLFADTPVALLEDAAIGSRAFINHDTGRFVTSDKLAKQLTEFVDAADQFRPRRWAEANISCQRSSAVLNDTIKRHMLARGEAWTRDLAPLCWRPDPWLVRPEDRRVMQTERLDLQRRFGLEIGPADLD
jgi:hypothetical protein